MNKRGLFNWMNFFREGEGAGAGAAAGAKDTNHTVTIKVDTAGAAGGGAGAGAGDGGDKGKTPEMLRAEAAERRVEANQATKRAEEAERKLAETETSIPVKIKEATAPFETRLTKLQSRTLDAEIKVAAQAAGIVDLDLIPLLDKTNIKIDDDGNVTGVTEAITDLKTKKPAFFGKAGGGGTGSGAGAGSGAGGQASGAGGAPPPDGGTTVDVRTMSKADYATWKKTQLKGLQPARH